MALVSLIVVCAAAACGSSSSTTTSASGGTTSNVASSGTTASSGGSNLKGAPLKIAISVPIGVQAGNYPQWASAVKAAARAINSSGGIKGRPLVVDVCNGQGDPNIEASCARSIVSSGAIASVSSVAVANPGAFDSELAHAGVAEVAENGSSPTIYSGDNTFEVDFAAVTTAACTTKQFVALSGASSDRFDLVATVIAPTASVIASTQAAAKAQGTQLINTVKAQPSTTDFSPIVGQVSNDNPGFVDTFLPGQIAPLVTAEASLGKNWPSCTAEALVPTNTLAPLNSALGSHFYSVSTMPPLSAATTIPAIKEFLNDEAAEVAAGDTTAGTGNSNYDDNMLRAWLGVKIVQQVANSISGPITRATFLKAMQTAKVSGMGIVPNINFAAPQQVGTYARVFNPDAYFLRWDSSTKTWALAPQNATVNLAKALNG